MLAISLRQDVAISCKDTGRPIDSLLGSYSKGSMTAGTHTPVSLLFSELIGFRPFFRTAPVQTEP
jgi:hypothetical protein